MSEGRPDPDALLRELEKDQRREQRGRLKVFLGAVAGVGKTYAMLSEAHQQLERGEDVVIGVIETHGRRETDALTIGLEALPQREVEYRGIRLCEFDLDLALDRKPSLVLVDELAHTNAPGSRHLKRWQDVEELLRSGISVYTAVNIQHVETLNDIVAQISGITVRETVPDSFLESANEIEVVDVPPEELRQRLNEGKVYIPEQAEKALDGFFKEGNLIALRELALRHAAERVDAELQSYRARNVVQELVPAGERILVCVAPNPVAARVVRAARRLAATLHADVVAAYVESPRQGGLSPARRDLALEALRLAESLGIETVTLGGDSVVDEILRFAKARNVTTIVVGKPVVPRWREAFTPSFVGDLVRRSGDIGVTVVSGDPGKPAPGRWRTAVERTTLKRLLWTLGIVLAETAICALLFERVNSANLAMVYLLGVAYLSSRFGVQEAALAAFLSVGAFDFFFVKPHLSFAVSDTQFLITFAVMLGVGLLISRLTSRLKSQARAAGDRERRTAALYALSREMARSRSKAEIGAAAAAKMSEVFDCDVGVLIVSDARGLRSIAPSRTGFEGAAQEKAVAQWVFDHDEIAGCGTNTLPGAAGLYLPLHGARGGVGVLALHVEDPLDPQQMHLLETFANQLALAMERTILAKETQEAHLQVESERLRNSLLDSVSHDLRTPLTVISGAAEGLLAHVGANAPNDKELLETILEESQRLERFVGNLLQITRVESGALELRRDWHPIEELIGSALKRTERLLCGRKVVANVEEELPLVRVDGALIEQVLVNLLDNAARHTAEKVPIWVNANLSGGFLRVEVADEGPGIAPGDEDRIFGKFERGSGATPATGFGLGLSICRGVLRAHDGRIWARNRVGGGAAFIFELPVEPQPAVPKG